MTFDSLDEYLLTAVPRKADVVAALLADPAPVPAAQPFYEGMRLLGARTPDLTLLALRLVLSGRGADDAGVVQLRALSQRAREGDAQAAQEYRRLLSA
jgi:hypothetical protein